MNRLVLSKRYYSENLKIAFPVILSLAGQSIVQIIDTIMVGRLGTVPLAAVSLSCSIITNITVIGIGIAMGLTPLTGVEFVRNKYDEASYLFHNSLFLNLIVALSSCAILLIINPMLAYIGQPSEVLACLDGYYYWVSFSIIPFLIFLSLIQWLRYLRT